MSFMSIPNIRIAGIGSCVPSRIEHVNQLSGFDAEKADKFSKTTGVYKRRVASDSTCASDLCQKAAETIIGDLGWEREDIGCLIFVSQTPDYILPATSCILQDKLKLEQNTLVLDISLGCSGWVYGLSVISALMNSGRIKKGLLLAGDTPIKTKSPQDMSSYPLFGDAGTATALEYNPDCAELKFHFGCDGSKHKAIIIPDGGFRNKFSEDSLLLYKEDDISRNRLQTIMDSVSVFSFGITKAPRSVNSLMDYCGISKDDVNYFIFHQANQFMCEVIRKKLKLPSAKVPYSLDEYGNTSSASIPLTINTRANNGVSARFIACGFGVGLSWASVYFETDNLVLSTIQEIK